MLFPNTTFIFMSDICDIYISTYVKEYRCIHTHIHVHLWLFKRLLNDSEHTEMVKNVDSRKIMLGFWFSPWLHCIPAVCPGSSHLTFLCFVLIYKRALKEYLFIVHIGPVLATDTVFVHKNILFSQPLRGKLFFPLAYLTFARNSGLWHMDWQHQRQFVHQVLECNAFFIFKMKHRKRS